MTSGHRLFRFALVGTAVAVLYILLYAGFMALGMPQAIANALAFLVAVAVQYLGQAGLTFDAPWRDRTQALRFAAMIGLGLLTSALITGALGPAFGWHALVSAAVVTLVLPIQNFVIMSRWVFSRRRDQMETVR